MMGKMIGGNSPFATVVVLLYLSAPQVRPDYTTSFLNSHRSIMSIP